MEKQNKEKRDKKPEVIKPSSKAKSPSLASKQPMTGPAKTKKNSLKAEKASLESKKILELKKELIHLNEKKEEGQLIKDAKGRHYCHDEHCDQPAVTDIYCRYHYLALWKYIQQRKKLLRDNYLLKTTEQLIQSFGEGALNLLIHDMKSEKSFESAVREMNIPILKEERALHSTAERADF